MALSYSREEELDLVTILSFSHLPVQVTWRASDGRFPVDVAPSRGLID